MALRKRKRRGRVTDLPDLTCSWCGTLRGSIRFGNRPPIGGEGERGMLICDLCVADLLVQCRANFGPQWPQKSEATADDGDDSNGFSH
jgi:hypothetical protein